ncbi:ECF RNA polymerase sigma-E factor [Posidoniimonas polymericola]|uniref:ECF RNA polymerase sigma-E factor n=1 Tax=Posidoniimonas polymericola TaxID=2528002 RepID=A0A5C5YQ01_9BACT|nr:sigma-70 family RNA polymerase sigma factor [Posidoniimonas polymericola]TWT77004.1 ECF RNA polymerase sigma-E factor [Posidoniimonas polymericola]
MDASSPSNAAAALLDRANAGSTSSLGRLMGLYSEYLKFVVSSQMDDRLRHRVSASDVVQESFYEAHRDFAAFRGESPQEFLAWLRRILVNNLMRVVERNVTAAKRDVRREVSLERLRRGVEQSSWRFSAMLESDVDSPSTNLRRQESNAELAEVLAKLPADYRRVIRLRNIEGLAFAEVASRMDRTSGAARMLWLRALEQLRLEYSGEIEE